METTPIDILRSAIAGNAYAALRTHAEAHGLGYAFPAGLYYVLWRAGGGTQVKMGRTPDASFVRKARLPGAYDLTLPFAGAPDLAVEVVTITESNIFTLDKVRDYLAAGCEQVWVAFTAPLAELHVYRRDDPKTVHIYTPGDTLDAGEPLPGLRVDVAALFKFP